MTYLCIKRSDLAIVFLVIFYGAKLDFTILTLAKTSENTVNNQQNKQMDHRINPEFSLEKQHLNTHTSCKTFNVSLGKS